MTISEREPLIGRPYSSVRRFGPLEMRRLRDANPRGGIRHEVYLRGQFIGMTWWDRHRGWWFKAMTSAHQSVEARTLDQLGMTMEERQRR